jgi:hypothetical protein
MSGVLGQRLHAVVAFTNNSFEIGVAHWYNKSSTQFQTMMSYSIHEPLVAVRISPSPDGEITGVMSSLPSGAVVESSGPCELGNGMVEVVWEHQQFAVFQRDLVTRATPLQTASVGD